MKKIGKRYYGSKLAIKVYQDSDAVDVLQSTLMQLASWLSTYDYNDVAGYIDYMISDYTELLLDERARKNT